ncbi:MAG: hypothetical protein HUU50_13425 [Candidatus Brocadiae bacterium]|nr:hypothetical protein [Candidatus Brocadiia bacterium]
MKLQKKYKIFMYIISMIIILSVGKVDALENHDDLVNAIASLNTKNAFLTIVHYDQSIYSYGDEKVVAICVLVMPYFKYNDISESLMWWFGLRNACNSGSLGENITKGFLNGIGLTMDDGKTSLTLEMLLLSDNNSNRKYHIYRGYDKTGNLYVFTNMIRGVAIDDRFNPAIQLGKTIAQIHSNPQFQYANKLEMTYREGYLEIENTGSRYYVGNYSNVNGCISINLEK